MYCRSCGQPLADDAKYCGFCGAQTEVGEAVSRAASEEPVIRPSKKRNHREKAQEKSAQHPLLRILFVALSLILLWHTIGSLIVDLVGESTRPTNVTFSFQKQEPNGGKNDYLWYLNYTFSAAGKEYSGFTSWHGTRYQADSGWVNIMFCIIQTRRSSIGSQNMIP